MPIPLTKTTPATQAPESATGKQEPLRDGKGQYRFTRPDGELRSYTRCSTIAGTLEDTLKLHQWEMRKMAKGLSDSPDLLKLLQGHDPDEDRGVYDEATQTALSRAKTNEAANDGTALHRFTELWDLGKRSLDEVPDDFRPHVERYAEALEASGFEVVAGYIEQIIIDDNYGFGGQIDRVLRALRPVEVQLPDGKTVTIPEGALIVGDLKTGKLAEYKFIGFATQITGYANHTATWEVDHDHDHGGTRGPRIDVSREVAVIIHLPATDPNPNCSLHWVDLAYGLEYFQEAITVRGLRSAPYKRQLVGPYLEVEAPPVAKPAAAGPEPKHLRTRLNKLKAHHPAALKEVLRQWPVELRDPDTGMPRPFPDEPTWAETAALSTVLGRVEAAHEIPFV